MRVQFSMLFSLLYFLSINAVTGVTGSYEDELRKTQQWEREKQSKVQPCE